MKKNIRRRTAMFIETHEITIIRTSRRQQTAFCELCQTEVSVFSVEQIAAFLKIDMTEVCRLIETKQIHLIGRRGFALVCADSLTGDGNYSLQINRS